MQHAEQHRFESRFGRIAAAAAIAAALLPIASMIFLSAALGERGEGLRGALTAFERQSTGVVAASIVQAISTSLIALVLYFLYRAARYRIPRTPAVALPLALIAPVVVGLSDVGLNLALIDAGRDFVSSGDRSEGRAEVLVREGATATAQYAGYAARAVLGTAFVLISLYAMRAGLLSRFMAYVGIIIGALFVLAVLLGSGLSFILVFWLPALALLFLDRWPGGRGPAWDAGEALPWPSPAEQRQALERKRAEEGDEVVPAAGGPNGAGPASVDPDTPRPPSPRKRKRRR